MQAERWIALEAVDPTRNLFRAWRCEIGTDLFGAVMMSVTFGRIGSAGRTIARTVADQGAADAALRGMLVRRASAPRRIGVGYRVIGICDLPSGMTEPLATRRGSAAALEARVSAPCR